MTERWTDVHMAYWQPISTAPKDGKDILVFLDGNRHDFSRIAVVSWVKGGFVEYAWDKETLYPTHWMRLPEYPK